MAINFMTLFCERIVIRLPRDALPFVELAVEGANAAKAGVAI